MAQRRGLRAVLFGAVAVAAISSGAAAQAREINIPAEDLKIALDFLIFRQSGVQLVYTVRDVEGRRSHAVQGRYEAVPALDELLQGTQLAANRDVSGAVIVSRNRTAAPDPGPSGTPANIEQVVVTTARA